MAADQPTRAFAVPDPGHRSLGSGVEGAGECCAAPAFFVIPVLESVRFLYVCALVLNIPQQRVITRDKVAASRSITTNQDYRFAIAQYNQAAMRDVVGCLSLDELLSERERIQEQMQAAVESQAHQWGISIELIQLQEIELAEREKRATITKADGDRSAAATMAANPIALELRTLQTIDRLGACPFNTVVLFPLELSQGLNALLRRTDEPPST